MKCTLYGFRRVDMTDERGRQIKGNSIFVGYPSNGVEGHETTKLFVSDDMAYLTNWVPAVGAELELDFTPRGRLSAVRDALD